MGFLYSLLLKLISPTSVCVVLLLAALAFRKREKFTRGCVALAAGLLLVCGNGWVVRGLVGQLEGRYAPLRSVPQADCILILGGGESPALPPRPTVEVNDAGDRLVYGAHLFRRDRAPVIVCTAGVSTGGVALRPGAEEMADFLEMIGVPRSAIVNETQSSNTRDHGRNLRADFQRRGYQRVLLVTSALHMPRSMGVLRKACPEIEFIPAPTDFRVTKEIWLSQKMEKPSIIPETALLPKGVIFTA